MTQNKGFFIVIGLIFIGLLYLLAPVLTPFLTGALLAYLVNPLVTRLMKYRIPRLLAVSIVFVGLLLILLLLILLLIPLVQAQVSKLTVFTPKMIDWFQQTISPRLTLYLGSQDWLNTDLIKSTIATEWTKAGSFASVFFTAVLHSGVRIAAWLLNLILIPVVTFYFLRDWQKVMKGVRDLIPRKNEPALVKLAIQCDHVLSAFFRGQFLVMLFIAVYYSIGLSIIGLDIGVILGLILGIISIVPYLGIIVGIVSASIAAFVQFGSFHPVLWVWGLFALGQVLDTLFVTPNLVGDRIGLHPVVVIFAILAGGSLFGFFGVLLALPVAAVIMVWLRFLDEHYHKSHLYR
jgi:predicted PurR-regulated permease PerM